MKREIRVRLAVEVVPLRTKWTEAEHGKAGEELGKIIKRFDDMVDRHKAERSIMKEQENRVRDEVRELATDLREGGPVEQVECVWVADFDKKMAELIRTDTNEIVRVRPMTDDDRQIALDRAHDAELPPVPIPRRDNGGSDSDTPDEV